MPQPRIATDLANDQERQHRTILANAINELIKVRPESDLTEAEISAGVTPVNFSHLPYIRGRYGSFTDWRLACDEAGAEGRLEADYAIDSAIDLPNKCDFRGFKITGAFDTIHSARDGGHVRKWRAKQVVIRGCTFCQYTAINTEFDFPPEDTGSILIDGGVSVGEAGTEECDIEIAYTRTCTVTNDNGYVNFNRIHGSGKALYVHFTGTHGSNEMHANEVYGLNVFKNGSGSNWGLVNDCTVQQTNFADVIYFEAGANIVGQWDVWSYQGDAEGLSAVKRRNYLLGAVGVNQRLSADFIPLSVRNLAQGGEWDMLDTSGKPLSLTQSGGASVSVSADSTEPSGCGMKYQADFADAFDNFQFTLQPSGSDRFGICIYYQSTADFAAVESNDGSGAISHTVTPVVVDSVNNWKLIRIAGPASKTSTTSVTLYGYAGTGGATKTMAIGGFFAGSEKAVRLPQKNTEIVSGTFLGTLTGVTATIQGNVTYERNGNRVTLAVPSLNGTSNANTCTITGMSSFLIPRNTQGLMVTLVTNNGVAAIARIEVDTSGVIVAYPDTTAAANTWSAVNGKGITRFNMTYLVN